MDHLVAITPRNSAPIVSDQKKYTLFISPPKDVLSMFFKSCVFKFTVVIYLAHSITNV